MAAFGNFFERVLSSLKTDRDVPVGVSDPGDERGALHVFQMNSALNIFGPPATTTKTTSVKTGNVQTIKFFNGLTLLKTVTVTYSGCDFEAVVSVP